MIISRDAAGTAEIRGTSKRSRRMAAMLDLIAERGAVTLTELTEQFDSSAATVRRDLTVLSDQGFIIRTHGGAKPAGSLDERPVALRNTRFQEAKRRIGLAAAARIPRERHAVALSGGTTTAAVARELTRHTDLTIVTNSLGIASLAAPFPRLRVVMTGGILRPQSLELVGVLAEGTFNAINISTAILGADGFTSEAGVTTHDETEARTNHAMISKAQRTIVVADGSKIGKVALAQMSPSADITMLITDDTADPDELERLRAQGIEVVIA